MEKFLSLLQWRNTKLVDLINEFIDKTQPYQFPEYNFKHEIRFFHKDLFQLIDEGNLEIACEYVLRIYQGI